MALNLRSVQRYGASTAPLRLDRADPRTMARRLVASVSQVCFLGAVLASLGSVTTHAQPPGALRIEIMEAALRATGATRGGAVVWLGVTRHLDAVTPTTSVFRQVVRDDDQDGAVIFEVGDEAAQRRSIWIAVDLATGRLATKSPRATDARETGPPPGNVRPGPSGKLDRLLHAFERGEFLVVRPRVGAWSRNAANGGPGDEDTDDGELSFLLDALEPLEGSPAAPEELAADDVLAVVDSISLDFYAVRLVGQPRG